MLSEFLVYLRLGFEHITDPGGADHLLFVAALTATDVDRPKHLVWLVTAFTLGHSLTLALATLHLVSVSTALVEILIPLTIIATCALNVTGVARITRGRYGNASPPFAAAEAGDRMRYALAAVFGLIHGLGFSAFLRAALGGEQGIVWPLFAFNSGLELGQLVIVAGLVVVAAGLMRFGRLGRPVWTLGVSGAAALAAGVMIAGRL
jgi:hypothetical protein